MSECVLVLVIYKLRGLFTVGGGGWGGGGGPGARGQVVVTKSKTRHSAGTVSKTQQQETYERFTFMGPPLTISLLSCG